MARILVVDDDEETRESFECLLRTEGHDPVQAESGERALDLGQAQAFDVILLDVKLPGISGLEVMRQLRSLGITTPCIMMTGLATLHSAVDAIKLGAFDYLQKPVLQDELECLVQQALGYATPNPPKIIRADGISRWAMAVASVLDASHDPKNLVEWSLVRGVAPETLRSWCRAASLPPKRSLDLARVLRAVSQASQKGSPPERFLDAADQRTMRRLLAAGGLDIGADPTNLEETLNRQSLITDTLALDELRRVLRELGIDLER